MYIILVYDIGEKRVGKVLKTCRLFLNWVQQSVFEGEISDANFKILKTKLKKITKADTDSVLIYIMRTTKYFKKEIIGIEKNKTDNIF